MNKKIFAVIIALIIIFSSFSYVLAENGDNEEGGSQGTSQNEQSGEEGEQGGSNNEEGGDENQNPDDDSQEPTEKTTVTTTKATTTTTTTTTTKATTKSTKSTTKSTATTRNTTTTEAKEEEQEPVQNEVEEREIKDGDYCLDFLHSIEDAQTGELGYFEPYFSYGAGSLSAETGLDIKSVREGLVGINFTENEIKTYKYAFIKVKSSNAELDVDMSLKIGDVTLPFSEWVLSNGDVLPANLSTDYKTYAIDLRANKISALVTHSTDSELTQEDDNYDIQFISEGAGGANIRVESIVFTNDKPVYKAKSVAKKSLAQRLLKPVLLLVASIIVLFVVNFIIYKRKKYNDNMVKRSSRNGQGNYRRR